MDGPARWRILRLHVEDGIPLSALARETGISLRSLERWHARYRADGYAGLETGQRSDAGAHHLPGELVRLIEGLALSKPRPAIATIHRKVTDICGTRGWPVPSYGVVRSIAGALDPGMVTLALEGAASYRDKHELVLRRHAEQPNAMSTPSPTTSSKPPPAPSSSAPPEQRPPLSIDRTPPFNSESHTSDQPVLV